MAELGEQWEKARRPDQEMQPKEKGPKDTTGGGKGGGWEEGGLSGHGIRRLGGERVWIGGSNGGGGKQGKRGRSIEGLV